ncbi:MAG: GNAT family N-acetyltransferase [Streptosporangiaceae bacterium]
MTSHDDSTRYPVPGQDARPKDRPWPRLAWPPPAGMTLTGQLTELRVADPDRDGAALFEALDFDAVWQHVASRPGGPADWSQLLTARMAAGMLPWVLVLRRPCAGLAAGALAGTSTYSDVSVGDARLEIGSTAYHPAAWGTAVNADAKLVLLSYAFGELGAGRVQLKTDVRNVRSQRAIAALGARYEGTLRRYQRRGDGTVRDTALFSITAEDWPAARAMIERRLAGRLAALDAVS